MPDASLSQSQKGLIKRWGLWLLSIPVGLSGVFIFFRHFFLSGGTRIIGDMADGQLLLALHEHWYRVLSGREGFFEMGFFYPEEHVLGYSDTFLLPGLIHSFFRFLGLDQYLSFQLVQIVLCLLGFAGMMIWLAKWRKIPYTVSLLCAFLFIIASPIYIESRNSHMQLQAVWLIPWILICIELVFRHLRENPKGLLYSFTSLCLLYGLIVYSTFYIAWFFLLFTILWIISWLIMAPRSKWFFPIRLAYRSAKYLLPGILTLATIALLFFATYLPARQQFGGWEFARILYQLPDFWHIINHSEMNLLWGNLSKIIYAYPITIKWTHEIGSTLLLTVFSIIVAISLVVRRNFSSEGRSTSHIVITTTALALLISFLLLAKVGDFTLWYLPYQIIPGGEAIRVPLRYVVLLLVPMLYLTAWGLTWISETGDKRISYSLLVSCNT